MDMQAVHDDGISFFVHRATIGTKLRDTPGASLAAARKAGIPFLGCYVVVRSAPSPAAQVDYLLDLVTNQAPWWESFPGWFWEVDTEVWDDDRVAIGQGADIAQLLEQHTARRALHYAPEWSYGQTVPAGPPLWASSYVEDTGWYRTLYPGDASERWHAYSKQVPAILQYSSKAIIGRQPTCCADAFRGEVADFAKLITIGGAVAQTLVPAEIDSHCDQFAVVTGSPRADVGSAPNVAHKASGGYHCGALDLRAINAVGNDDYSIRQPRDRNRYNADVAAGRNDASAIDWPDDWPRGGRAAWLRFNNLLRKQAGAGDPALSALRGINYSPDGVAKRRFDCLTMTEGPSSDSVTIHTHGELWRDTIGAAARRVTLDRILQIAIAARDNAPLPLLGGNPVVSFMRAPNGSVFMDAGGELVPVPSMAEVNAVTPPVVLINLPQSLFDRAVAMAGADVINLPAFVASLVPVLSPAIADALPDNVDTAAVVAAFDDPHVREVLTATTTQGVKDL
jgi:hypothetical protein